MHTTSIVRQKFEILFFRYRKNRDISEEQHNKVIEQLGYTKQEFEELKHYENTTGNNHTNAKISNIFAKIKLFRKPALSVT